jgi:hypothetical protein
VDGDLLRVAMGKAPGWRVGDMAMAAISDWILTCRDENATLRAMDERCFPGIPEGKPEARVSTPAAGAKDDRSGIQKAVSPQALIRSISGSYIGLSETTAG